MTGHVTHPAGAILEREGEQRPQPVFKMARGGGRPLPADGRCAAPRRCRPPPPDRVGGRDAAPRGCREGQGLPLSIRDSLTAAGGKTRPYSGAFSPGSRLRGAQQRGRTVRPWKAVGGGGRPVEQERLSGGPARAGTAKT